MYNIAIAKKYKNTASLYTSAVFLENTIYATFYQRGNFTINGNASRKWQMADLVRNANKKGIKAAQRVKRVYKIPQGHIAQVLPIWNKTDIIYYLKE